jgi:outer membrane protein TolC
MIGPRRERSIFAQPFEDSIGIFLTIPFGGRSHVDAAAAAAGREVAAAHAELRRVERSLDLALHEAEHSLHVARENRRRADDRAALARRGFAMGETAYAAGEIGLVELLALQEAWIEATERADRLAIEVNRQVALYNQAVGVLP